MTNLLDDMAMGLCKKVARIAPIKPLTGKPFLEKKFLVVCMTPRSGSTYFAALLRENGIGNGQEHFRVAGDQMQRFVNEHSITSYEEYFRRMVRARSRNDIFCVKCDWPQFAPLYFSGVYQHYLRDAHFVYLTRKNVLEQAVSRFIGTETGYFHSTNESKKKTLADEVSFSADGITSHLEHLLRMQYQWEYFFAESGISPLRIFYEDLDQNPGHVLEKTAAFVSVQLPAEIYLDNEYERVRNDRNAKLADEYKRVTRGRVEKIMGSYYAAD